MRRKPGLTAFTLVELLVVITIIVVLLALLTPALDKAIYQAELAVDGANLHGIGIGAMNYAMNYRRSYPDRFTAQNTTYMASWIKSGGLDDRPKMQPFLDLKMLADPFCGKVDFGIGANDADSTVDVNYNLYFGHRFFDNNVPQPGMMRLGDKLEWKGERFGVLAKELDRIGAGQGWADNSHPDREGRMEFQLWQNRYQVGVGSVGVGKYTLSRWELTNGDYRRGPVDQQAVFDDGAVRRYTEVTYDQGQIDPGWSQVPNYTSAQSYPGGEYHNMPLR